MARSMADDYQETFRARVEFVHTHWNDDYSAREADPDATRYVEFYGPYATAAAAKSVGSRKGNRYGCKALSVTVQRAEIEWKDVEAKP